MLYITAFLAPARTVDSCAGEVKHTTPAIRYAQRGLVTVSQSSDAGSTPRRVTLVDRQPATMSSLHERRFALRVIEIAHAAQGPSAHCIIDPRGVAIDSVTMQMRRIVRPAPAQARNSV